MCIKIKWTKRKIGLIVLFSFLLTFTILLFIPDSRFANIQRLTKTQRGVSRSHLYPKVAPAIQFEYEVTFSAVGAFSVNNPINVKVTLKDLNITNFLDYFCGVSFSDAYAYPLDEEDVTAVIVYLEDNGDGTYSGECDVVWLVEGPTHMVETINNPEGYHFTKDIFEDVDSPLLISGVSDTLSIKFTKSTSKLEYQIWSFSILVLQPILEAILLKEEKKK